MPDDERKGCWMCNPRKGRDSLPIDDGRGICEACTDGLARFQRWLRTATV